MLLHPLAPDVSCPTCGAGLTFIRMRVWGDLYQCSGGRCKCRVVHYWNKIKTTKTCGYSVIYGLGRLEKWTECGERPAAAKKE
jgi:hypothetical protein